MGRSFFNGSTDTELASGSRLFAAKLAASAGEYGIDEALAAEYVAVDAEWQSAYAANVVSVRTRSATVWKNRMRRRITALASKIATIIAGNPAVSDEQRIGLNLSVRAQPSPLPAPGKPARLKTTLDGDGSLILSWKCDNPEGSRGTQYEIYRSIANGPFVFLQTVGKKRFRDHTLPEGPTGVVYKLRAIRSTKVGAWAEFNIHFGGGSPNLIDLKRAA